MYTLRCPTRDSGSGDRNNVYFVLFGARTRQDKAVPTIRGEGWQSKIFV